MKTKPFRKTDGYSMVQMLITLAVAMIISGFAIVGISRARDHVRLMNSAREFAAYVERARADAVRRHGQATVQTISEGRYRVTMDFDGNGSIDATDIQTFGLQSGVRFTTGIKGVTFDWRGRIPGEQSFGFSNGRNQVSVGVTGSGDVTFDAQYFSDSLLPGVTYTGTPQGGFIPDPSPSPGIGPYPSPTPTSTPTPTQNPSPTPTPTPTPGPTGYPSPTPTGTGTPYPSPTPTGTASPSPTPTGACLLNASPDPLSVVSFGSGSISVNRTNATGSGTITATSSNNGQIQVSPSSQIVSGTSSASFTVTVKKAAGSVTFASTGCTGKTVTLNIQ